MSVLVPPSVRLSLRLHRRRPWPLHSVSSLQRLSTQSSDGDQKDKPDRKDQQDKKDRPKLFRRDVFLEIASRADSKVHQTLKNVITQRMSEQKHPAYNFIVDKRNMAEPPPATTTPWYKRLHTKQFWVDAWEITKKEAKHYAVGFKLLWTDIKVAWRLTRQVLKGDTLSRRERRQLTRTVGDIFRLVPFSAFIIVPGLELTLPFFIKFFPGMLPSQFQEQKTEEAKLEAELRVKLEMAKFLHDTMRDMAVERSAKDEQGSASYKELSEFLERNRAAGYVPTADILKFAPLFKDAITIDSLSREHLKALCRLIQLDTYGTDNMLRFRISNKLKELKADDMLIASEGLENMSVQEMQVACRERGMRAIGISEEGLRQRLQQWLDLHLTHNIPPTMLLMSRILYLPDDIPISERIRVVMEALPDDVKKQVKVEALETEGGTVDAHMRLEIIAAEEEKIKEEERQEEEQDTQLGVAKPAAAAAAKVDKEELVDKAPVMEPVPIIPSAIGAKAKVKIDPRFTLEDCIELTEVLAKLSGEGAQPELKALKLEFLDYKEDIDDLKSAADGKIKEARSVRRLSSRVERLLGRVESSLKTIRAQGIIELDQDKDGVISRSELLAAMKRMKSPPSEEMMVKIADMLDADKDGLLRLDIIQTVLQRVVEEGVDVLPQDLQELSELVEKETRLKEELEEAAGHGLDSGLSSGTSFGAGGVGSTTTESENRPRL